MTPQTQSFRNNTTTEYHTNPNSKFMRTHASRVKGHIKTVENIKPTIKTTRATNNNDYDNNTTNNNNNNNNNNNYNNNTKKNNSNKL